MVNRLHMLLLQLVPMQRACLTKTGLRPMNIMRSLSSIPPYKQRLLVKMVDSKSSWHRYASVTSVQSTGMHALESIRPLLHCSAIPVCNCYLHSQRIAITLLRATSTAHLMHMLSVEAMDKLSLSAQRSCAQDICIV